MDKYEEKRPWGKFEQFCLNEKATVKIITVQPHSKLSLQYHNTRDEFWRIINGKGKIVLGDDTIDVVTGEEYFIPRKTNHRMMTGGSIMEVMEISFGEFDENDIVRLEDEYDRT